MKKNADVINMIFYKCYQNSLRQLLKEFSKLYQLREAVTWPLLEGWCTKNQWFWRFFENISVSVWYFFVKSSLVARSYLVVEININLKFRCSSYPWNENQSPYFGLFYDFWHFSSCLFWHKPLAKDTDFFTKNWFNVYTLTCSKT